MMKQVYLSYNPYLVRATIKINGQVWGDPFSRYLEDYRLQYWMEKREQDNWAGLLGELRSAGPKSDELELTFHGTELDFQDLVALVKADGDAHFKQIHLVHENAESAKETGAEAKLEGLRDIYEDIKKGPVPEFHSAEVENAFEGAMNSDFEIVVIAPMSSGKSTLINAILGRNLLPAINQATTAVITRIRDVDGKPEYTVTAVDQEGNPICAEGGEVATLTRMTELNGEIDPNDPDGKRARAKLITLEGDIPALPARGLHTVFVDTPGGNNSLNQEHGAVMDEAIHNEDKSMVLYVFNGTQVSTEDNAAILRKIADAMRRSVNGKQSRDRFLFVANRMDDVDTERESYEGMVENIKTSLAEVGITDPNLYLVSAQAAKLLRMRSNKEPFTEDEDDSYDSLCKKMTRSSRQLFEYSSLTESQKDTFRKRVAQLREQNPDMRSIPEIAEINSGVPALEMAMAEYLEKYALAIKLKKAQDAFIGVVRDQDVKGKAHQRWSESEESFKAAQKEAAELKERLDKDKSLEQTFASIDKISFDDKPYRDQLTAFVAQLNGLVADYRDKGKVSYNEAVNLQNELESEIAPIQVKLRSLSDSVEADVIRQCNVAMAEYRKQLETLRANKLTDIGGIDVTKLSSMKKANNDTTVSMDAYRKVREVTYTVRVKDSGVGGFFKRLFHVGGYHDETRRTTEESVDFTGFARDTLSELQEALAEDIRDLIKGAKEQIEAIKKRAKEQASMVHDIVQEAVNDFEAKTRSRDELQKANEQELIALRFAESIIERVEKILNV